MELLIPSQWPAQSHRPAPNLGFVMHAKLGINLHVFCAQTQVEFLRKLILGSEYLIFVSLYINNTCISVIHSSMFFFFMNFIATFLK